MHGTSLVWDPAKNDEVYDIIYQNILFHFALLLKENFSMWVTSGSYVCHIWIVLWVSGSSENKQTM